jgi:hypothetical protein
MGFYADSWLREARDRVGTYPDQPTGGNYMDQEHRLLNNFKNTLSLHAGLSTTWNITLSETIQFSDASKSLRRYRGLGR